MNLDLQPDDHAFREELLEFLDNRLRPEWRGVADFSFRADIDITNAWVSVLDENGYLRIGWPSEFGGIAPWSPMQHYIFKAELARARAPEIPHMEFGMVAPLIYMFGNDRQKAHFLPRIASRTDLWAQGFSEPGAGSDLASLRATARRDGDHYIVDGQKTWTSFAHRASMMFCLLRSDPDAPKPHQGISMFLVPMDTPGIAVRPIVTIDGGHHLNEVFFDQARVPIECLLGEENKGWSYARALLSLERTGIAGVQGTRSMLDDIAALVGRNDELDRRLARLEITLDCLDTLELRTIDAAGRATGKSHDASMLKVIGTEVRQDALMVGLDALGPLAQIMPTASSNASGGLGRYIPVDALFFRAASIYGGTNEIQRNIIAKSILRSDVL